jgi:hypothetical protein
MRRPIVQPTFQSMLPMVNHVQPELQHRGNTMKQSFNRFYFFESHSDIVRHLLRQQHRLQHRCRLLLQRLIPVLHVNCSHCANNVSMMLFIQLDLVNGVLLATHVIIPQQYRRVTWPIKFQVLRRVQLPLQHLLQPMLQRQLLLLLR